MRKILTILFLIFVSIFAFAYFLNLPVGADLRIFTIPQGGTSTSTIPIQDQILIGNGSKYDLKKITAGSNVTIATTSDAITISSTGGSSGWTDNGSYLTTTGNEFIDVPYVVATSTTATSTFANTIRIGTTNTNQNLLSVVSPSGKDYSSSVSTGGVINLTTTNSTGAGLVIYNNQGATASGRLLSITADNTAFDQQALYVDQDGTSGAGVFNCDSTTGNVLECVTVTSLKTDKTTLGINGSPNSLGVLKISANGTGDTSSSLISIDGSVNGYLGQGIFAKGASGNNILTLRDNSNSDVFILENSGNVNISSPTATSTFAGGVNMGNATTGLFWDSVAGRLVIGAYETFQTIAGTTYGNIFSTHTEGATPQADIALHRHSDTATNGATLYGSRSRGTEASESVVQNGDNLLDIGAIGFDGTDYAQSSRIDMEVDGTPGSNDMPGRIKFSVSPDGSGTPVEAMRITNAGDVGVATSTPESRLDVWGASSGKILTLFSNAGTKFLEMLNTGVTTLLGVWDFGGATSLEIPNGASPTVDATGECALDTTSDQFKCFGASSSKVFSDGFQYTSFTYATSTWTGTTTIPLGTSFVAETVEAIQCYTDTGTVNVNLNDGTNLANMLNASTTVGTFTFSTNNTWTAAEKRYIDAGTPASSPTKLSCTVKRSLTGN